MKKIILYLVFTCIASSNQAQNLIAVQNGDVPLFFHQIDSAILHAQDGDTIFLPGGAFNITAQIDKELHIIGTGHHPDSTSHTYKSVLNGNLYLTAQASDGSIEGILITGGFGAEYVNGYSIARCNLTMLNFYHTCSNFLIRENILQGLISSGNGDIIQNCAFYNNIIREGFYKHYNVFINCIFKNNIFLNGYTSVSAPITTQYSIIENNIFICPYNCGSINYYVAYSAIKNNLFNEILTLTNQNVWLNNIDNYTGQIFVDQTGENFDYSQNYHLSPECPGNNAGTDGTDVGIYGGIFPWKEGSIPQNPHIKFKNISGATDQNGNLNVNIRVAAQDN